jgi:hypothetical protein
MEARLIATSPKSCVEILKKLFQKDGIPEILSENSKIFVDHVTQFPGGLGLSGLKILLASAQLKEPENFFEIDNFSRNNIFLLMGVSRDIEENIKKHKEASNSLNETSSNLDEMPREAGEKIKENLKGLVEMPQEIITKIFKELKPSQSAQAPKATQIQQPLLNPSQGKQ